MKRILAAALLTLAAVAPANAQAAHPDFSGKWTLDSAQSEPGPLTPSALTYTIEQHGDSFRIVRFIAIAGGESNATLAMAADGKPWKNEWQQNGGSVSGTSTVTWDGASLVIRTAVLSGAVEVQQSDRWTLAPDGKSFSIDRRVETQGQELTGRVVVRRGN